MNVLLKLFFMFAKLSAFSFGGGYVMIPIMLKELEGNGLINISEVTDIVALAGMSPGSVAVNAAVGIGYKVANLQGAFAAALGIIVPNFIIVILAALFFFKIYHKQYVKNAFYGLRPVIIGIILYAAVSFALKNSIIGAPLNKIINNGYNIVWANHHIVELKSFLLIILSFLLLLKTKVHPILVIIIGGIAGIAVF